MEADRCSLCAVMVFQCLPITPPATFLPPLPLQHAGAVSPKQGVSLLTKAVLAWQGIDVQRVCSAWPSWSCSAASYLELMASTFATPAPITEGRGEMSLWPGYKLASLPCIGDTAACACSYHLCLISKAEQKQEAPGKPGGVAGQQLVTQVQAVLSPHTKVQGHAGAAGSSAGEALGGLEP